MLIPNLRGLELALAYGVRNVLVTIGATNSFNKRNVNRTVDESLDEISNIIDLAGERECTVDVAVSVAFGCPFEGRVSPARVVDLCADLGARGVAEIGVADTIGVATPVDVTAMCALLAGAVPIDRLSLHVHDTRGLGVANVIAAFNAGVRRFDGSVGGVGGCPFAPRSTGNVCSEDALAGTARAGRADRNRRRRAVHGRGDTGIRPAPGSPGQAVPRRHLEWRSSGNGGGDECWLKSVRDRLQRAQAGGPTRHREKLAGQHKLVPRERIRLLFDPDTDFVEDGLLAGTEDPELAAEGVVTGIGVMHGRTCAVMANDPTVKAGSWGPRTVEKIIRIQETAERLQIPLVYLVNSAGARITEQVAMFPGGATPATSSICRFGFPVRCHRSACCSGQAPPAVRTFRRSATS